MPSVPTISTIALDAKTVDFFSDVVILSIIIMATSNETSSNCKIKV